MQRDKITKPVHTIFQREIDSSLHDTSASPFFVDDTTKPAEPQSKLANKFSFSEASEAKPSSQRSEEKEVLHQRFVAKFGEAVENRPAKRFKANDFTAKGISQTSAQPLKHKPKTNYTPLELQIVELKEKYPDVLLVVEVGYKYKFFGEDAKVRKIRLILLPVGVFEDNYVEF